MGLAFYQLGELYRLRGDFAYAEAACREAAQYGRAPQPGLSCPRLMQGDVAAAGAAIRRVMGETHDRVTRAQLLGAGVEIMLAVGDVDAATAAATELAEIAAEVRAPVCRRWPARPAALSPFTAAIREVRSTAPAGDVGMG